MAYSFQWEHCTVLTKLEEEEKRKVKCTAIPGATNSSYAPVLSDVGYKLAVKVGALNGGGLVTASTAESNAVRLATEYSFKGEKPGATGITEGPDKNIWVSYSSGVGRVTPAGAITEYPLTKIAVESITAGPEKENLWFIGSNTEAKLTVGKITTSGVVTEYTTAAATGPMLWLEPEEITAGADGNIWFTEGTAQKIGKITTAGAITEYALAAETRPEDITAGPDGNVWFSATKTPETSHEERRIGKITPAGVITEYPLPEENGTWPGASSMTTGPDEGLWFTTGGECGAPCFIGRLSTSGTLTKYHRPDNDGGNDIATGPDGKTVVQRRRPSRHNQHVGRNSRRHPIARGRSGQSGTIDHRIRRKPVGVGIPRES